MTLPRKSGHGEGTGPLPAKTKEPAW